MNYRYLNIYANRFKVDSALIIQLKIKKIKFNQFLHKQRIFNVLIAHCSCDNNHIKMKHTLLFYLNRKEKRRKMLQNVKITNIKRMLNKRKIMTIIICIILITDLLSQFQTTKLSIKEIVFIHKVLV